MIMILVIFTHIITMIITIIIVIIIIQKRWLRLGAGSNVHLGI